MKVVRYLTLQLILVAGCTLLSCPRYDKGTSPQTTPPKNNLNIYPESYQTEISSYNSEECKPPPMGMVSARDYVYLGPDSSKACYKAVSKNAWCAINIFKKIKKYPQGIRNYKKRYRYVLGMIHDSFQCFDRTRHMAKFAQLQSDPTVEMRENPPMRTTGQCYCRLPEDFPNIGMPAKNRFLDCFPEDPRVGKLDVDLHGSYGYYRVILSYYLGQLQQKEWYMVPIAQLLWAFANSPGPLLDPEMRKDLAGDKPRLGRPYTVDESTQIAKRAAEAYTKPCWYDLSALALALDGYDGAFQKYFLGDTGSLLHYRMSKYARELRKIRYSPDFSRLEKAVQRKVSTRIVQVDRLLHFRNIVRRFQMTYRESLVEAYRKAKIPVVNFGKLSRKQALQAIDDLVKATQLSTDPIIVRVRKLLAKGLRNLSPEYIPSRWAVTIPF